MPAAQKPGPPCVLTADAIDSGTLCLRRSPSPSLTARHVQVCQAGNDETRILLGPPGSLSEFPAASMLAGLAMGAAGDQGSGKISLAGKTLDHKNTLSRTVLGSRLFANLEQLNVEVYVQEGSLDGTEVGAATPVPPPFYQGLISSPRKFHVKIDTDKITKEKFDQCDAAEVLFHQLKAHVEGHREKITEYEEIDRQVRKAKAQGDIDFANRHMRTRQGKDPIGSI